MFIGGILAGGLGTRMRLDGLPKQFLPIGNIPVIVRTIQHFLEVKEIEYIFVAMNTDWIPYCSDLFCTYAIEKKVRIIPGGPTRFDSLLCLAQQCMQLRTKCNVNEDIILINHDCARPFVSYRILKDNLNMILSYDMTTTSIPAIDTVILSENGQYSNQVPDRQKVFLDQGPQAIHVPHFLKLVSELSEEERKKYIEAGKLYLDKGYRVGIVHGDRKNFKITTQLDLKLAELVLSSGEELEW